MINDALQNRYADRNLKFYVFIKVFTKRVFIPISAIYFVNVAGLNLGEIGLLAAFYSLVSLISEIPTGYFADRFKRVSSIRIGSALLFFSTLFYVFFPFKAGIFAGQAFDAIGFAFINGALEALIHDSLVVKGTSGQYSRVLSRAQSFSLIMNAILVALIPLTYAFDKRLPFMLASLAYAMLFGVALIIHDVNRDKPAETIRFINFGSILKKTHLLYWGLLFGLVSALYTGPPDITNLALKEFGLQPQYIGFVFSIASIVGAGAGFIIYRLKNIKASTYAALDVIMISSLFLAAFFRSYIILAIAVIVNIAFWRYRRIIYQDHILNTYPTGYKATIVSALNNLEDINLLWVPVLIAFLVSRVGISTGYLYVGVAALLLIIPFTLSTKRLFSKNS